MNVEELLRKIWETYSSIPWLGVFLISFLGNAIPYMTVPYLFIIAFSSAGIQDLYKKIEIIIAGGVGAGLGKLVVFMMGRAAHAALPRDVKKNMELFSKLFRRWGALAVFLFAALPLPDDILYVPLGVAGYNPLLFLFAVTAGKIVITGLAVLFGDVMAVMSGAESVFDPKFIIAMLIVSLYISYIIAKVNWMKVAEAMQKGWSSTIMVLAEELGRALIPVPRTRRGGEG